MKQFYLILLSLTITNLVFSQNVGIGTSVPSSSAKLEISSTNSGLLIPRVSLVAVTNGTTPVSAPAASLMVYNTNAAVTGGSGTGYYYWDGSVWVKLNSGAQAYWSLLGNSGTASGTNFIGTTDAVDFVTRTNNTERMRVTSGGNVGIGVTGPTNKLDIAAAARSGTHGTALPFYATGTVLAGSNGFEFRHDNGTQGIGLGFNTIYATGTNAAQDLGLASRGTGNLNFTTNATQRMIILGSNGNVGIGLTNPAYGLELNGTFGYGNGTPGAYRSRTETRNDAGQIASQSGFFETSAPAPATSWPVGANSWWHLIDVRHSNNGNNYAMQIAGSFFDQDFWVRKTNGNGAQSWVKMLTTANGWQTLGNAGTVAGTNFIGTTDAVDFVTRTGNTERMRVTSGGNVGIGVVVPTQRLDVQGGNARINNTFVGDVGHGAGWGGISHSNQANTTGYGLISSSDGAFTLINKQNTGSGYIGFRIANSDVAVITNAGNMGIGTTTPGQRLDVNGTIRALDIYAAGGQNLIVGDDTYFSDLDVAHRLGLISASNANIGELKLGNSATNPVLSGNAGFLTIDQEVRIQNAANRFYRATRPANFTDQFDGGNGGVFISNGEVEEGGFWANGNYAMIMSPGDNDLVKFVDEDGLDNAGTAFDGAALRARIDGAGQYFQVSDKNSKINIVKLNNGLSRIKAINGYSYDFSQFPDEIAKGQKPIHSVGIIAQEVEKVLPEAVSNTDGQYMVNYNAFVPLFIEAIKEQQILIEEQRKLIDEMRKELDHLKEK